jgi:uncharacterized protein YjiS (DUF1127 family)
MSKHFRTVPSVFLYYHGSAFPQRGTQKASVGHDSQKLQQKPCQDEASSALLRDDHIVLLAIDALLALHASFRKWRNRGKTFRALAELNDRQLRDIGLVRDGDKYRALAGSDDV